MVNLLAPIFGLLGMHFNVEYAGYVAISGIVGFILSPVIIALLASVSLNRK